MAKEKAPETVESLMKKLRTAKNTKDEDTARSIRVKLRRLGHQGGLGEGAGRPKTKKDKPAAKSKKAKVAEPEAQEAEA
jgi:hypothetical protein